MVSADFLVVTDMISLSVYLHNCCCGSPVCGWLAWWPWNNADQLELFLLRSPTPWCYWCSCWCCCWCCSAGAVSRALNRNIFSDTVSVNDISLTNFYLSVGVLVDQNQILICVAWHWAGLQQKLGLVMIHQVSSTTKFTRITTELTLWGAIKACKVTFYFFNFVLVAKSTHKPATQIC